MIWLEVLVEGNSDVPAVQEVLQRKFNLTDGTHFRIHPHKGIGKLPKNLLGKPNPKHQGLLDQLPSKLRGFAKSLPEYSVVLVVLDADLKPCKQLLAELNAMLTALPEKPEVLFRLAIEETESWFIADIEAMKKAFPGQVKLSVLGGIEPDAVVGAWEKLAQSLGLNPKQIGSGSKLQWARRIAPFLNLDNPRSPSFAKLIQGLDQMVDKGEV